MIEIQLDNCFHGSHSKESNLQHCRFIFALLSLKVRKQFVWKLSHEKQQQQHLNNCKLRKGNFFVTLFFGAKLKLEYVIQHLAIRWEPLLGMNNEYTKCGTSVWLECHIFTDVTPDIIQNMWALARVLVTVREAYPNPF